MRIELRDALEFLFPDSVVAAAPCREMALDVPRGGIASACLLLNEVPVGARVRVAASETARWFRLHDVSVERNTGPVGFCENAESGENPFVIRRAPFRVFDAMQPMNGEIEADASTLALCVHLPIAPDAPAGERMVTLRVDVGGETHELHLRLHTWPVTLPTVGHDSLPYTNWFSLENVAARHGLTEWSETHWAMIERYAALMVHGRQNMFWTPFSYFFELHNGRPVLDVAKLRRYVDLFTRAGMHYIEGGHFAARTTGEWTCPTFSLGLTKALATSPEGNVDIHTIASQLMREIDANGWRERWIQHIADEPIAENAADYRILTGMVRKYMPGLPILDATLNEGLAGAVDIWCPQAQEYQRRRERFADVRAVGDQVYFYTCCFPGGPWLNRLLDMELLRPALFGWGAAHFRLDGFLHWGLNHYNPEQDPFDLNNIDWGNGNVLPAGDTHIIYPGIDGPWSSLRLEAQREGFEDYELLHQLQTANPDIAAPIIAPVLRGFDDYTKDVPTLRAARKALLTALTAM